MLFNSLEFILVFLPVTFLIAFALLRASRTEPAIMFLAAASLAFYGWWNPNHLWVIVASLVCNFTLGRLILGERRRRRRQLVLGLGIALNLCLLGYFKYLVFFLGVVAGGGSEASFMATTIATTALPIGISFYTFQQIAYLADCYADDEVPQYGLSRYACFVAFFPQLIAGPIVHHREIMPQLDDLSRRLRGGRYALRYLAPGLSLFIIGLAKKTLLADSFAIYADKAFLPETMERLTFLDAWGGAFAYTFQIYFDFSGYSDMALGLALLFGIRLPVNFLSPYKATSFSDFWQRWHITLSRFLRDYLYFPLGGSRRGATRHAANLMVTMLLGGLWHGAGWTFLLWGGLHGALLVLNHLWRAVLRWRPPVWLAVGTVFVTVMLTWVPFRAASLGDAFTVWSVMLGDRGIVLPVTYKFVVDFLGAAAAPLGIVTGSVAHFAGLEQIGMTLAGLLIVFALPNSMILYAPEKFRRMMRSRAVPVFLGAIAVAALAAVVLRVDAPFLYFQF